MDKSVLLMMLMQQAPRLLAALKGSGGLEASPNIANALEAGMDTGLMESRLAPLQQLNGDQQAMSMLDTLYSPQNQGFPSDGVGNEYNNLFGNFASTAVRRAIGGPDAALSAATFVNSPEQELPVIPSLNISTPEEEEMDFIHSNEAWDTGEAYKSPLLNWYRKHKR